MKFKNSTPKFITGPPPHKRFLLLMTPPVMASQIREKKILTNRLFLKEIHKMFNFE